MAAASPGSFAAHIQLAEHLTEPRPSLTAAHTRLVIDSATVRRAIAAYESSPLIGCSPTAVAAPATLVCECAMTPTSASGVCSGPTHCCCAMSPVTERSTLLVRKRFEPTDGRRSTRSSAIATVVSAGMLSGTSVGTVVFDLKVLRGMSASTSESGRSTGVELSSDHQVRPRGRGERGAGAHTRQFNGRAALQRETGQGGARGMAELRFSERLVRGEHAATPL